MKFGILIEEIKFKRFKSLFNFPMLLINRLIFSIIPIICYGHSGLQIMFLIQWTMIYIQILIYMKANISPLEYKIDIFNEVMLLLMYYELFWFVDGGLVNGTDYSGTFLIQNSFKIYIDYVFISIGFLVVLVNLLFVVQCICNSCIL